MHSQKIEFLRKCGYSNNPVFIFSLGLFLIALDQISKYAVRAKGGFFICNSDLAWGIPISQPVFWSFWILLTGFIVFKGYENYKKESMPDTQCSMLNTCCFTLILAGAFSNVLDRMALGCVVDFINWGFWPAFNLADVFVVLGGAGLFWKIWKNMV